MIYSKFQIICIPRFQIVQILHVLNFLQMKQRLPFWELTNGHCVYLLIYTYLLRPKSTAMAGRSVHLTTLFPGQA